MSTWPHPWIALLGIFDITVGGLGLAIAVTREVRRARRRS